MPATITQPIASPGRRGAEVTHCDVATLSKLREAVAGRPVRVDGTAEAAVAAIFNPDLDLLLMRRAEREGDPWSGHVSLPGGRVEPGEDAMSAAIRETREEVGLELEPHHLLGPLDDLAAVGGKPGLVIRPFVFVIDTHRPALSLEAHEVADTRWLGLRALLEGEGRSQFRFQRGAFDAMLPQVTFADHWSDTKLWGLTLRMIDDLMHRIDGRGIGLERTPPTR